MATHSPKHSPKHGAIPATSAAAPVNTTSVKRSTMLNDGSETRRGDAPREEARYDIEEATEEEEDTEEEEEEDSADEDEEAALDEQKVS